MSLTLALYWLQHRSRLKAQGYSFSRLRSITLEFWRRLEIGSPPQVQSAPTFTPTHAFTRHEFRARW